MRSREWFKSGQPFTGKSTVTEKRSKVEIEKFSEEIGKLQENLCYEGKVEEGEEGMN